MSSWEPTGVASNRQGSVNLAQNKFFRTFVTSTTFLILIHKSCRCLGCSGKQENVVCRAEEASKAEISLISYYELLENDRILENDNVKFHERNISKSDWILFK